MVKTSFRILNSCNLVGEKKIDSEIIKIREMQQKNMICFLDSSGALVSFLLANTTHFFSNLFLSAVCAVIDDLYWTAEFIEFFYLSVVKPK